VGKRSIFSVLSLKVILEEHELKRLFYITSIAFLLLAGARFSHAQAAPAATRTSGGIQIGAAYTFAKPDYGGHNIQGYTIYGDWDFTRHWGIEGDIHRVSVITPADVGEDSYLVGPRYVFRFKRFRPYAKGLLGFGRYKTDYDNRPNFTNTYKIYAIGGGVDVPITPHLNVRAFDFEYQGWPGYDSNGLTPYVFTFGAAYRFR
jgi:hypothetical protein